MSERNEFLDKAGAMLSKAAGTAKGLASAAAQRTKQLSRAAKLNMDIVTQKDIVRKAYAELGRLYYEYHHDAPEGLLAQACQEIDVANAAIADMEAEVALLRAGMEDVPEEDLETVVEKTAAQADVEVEIVTEEDADRLFQVSDEDSDVVITGPDTPLTAAPDPGE